MNRPGNAEPDRIRLIRQIAQARGVIERRRRKEAKNVLRFENPQTFIVVAFPVQGPLMIESIQKHTFAGARKHARRCMEELSGNGMVARPDDVKLFWLSPYHARKAMRNWQAEGVEIAL